MLTFILFLLAGAATAGVLTAHIRIGDLEAAISELQREVNRDRILAERGFKPRGDLWQPIDYEADYD